MPHIGSMGRAVPNPMPGAWPHPRSIPAKSLGEDLGKQIAVNSQQVIPMCNQD